MSGMLVHIKVWREKQIINKNWVYHSLWYTAQINAPFLLYMSFLFLDNYFTLKWVKGRLWYQIYFICAYYSEFYFFCRISISRWKYVLQMFIWSLILLLLSDYKTRTALQFYLQYQRKLWSSICSIYLWIW